MAVLTAQIHKHMIWWLTAVPAGLSLAVLKQKDWSAVDVMLVVGSGQAELERE